MKNKIYGDKGEAKAVAFLKKNKKKILQTNYKNILGEIDIIFKDKDFIVFCEVKSRSSEKFGRASLAVNTQKQNKIRNVALFYLKEHKLLETAVRFDVLEVYEDEINHIENAF
ncbi:MAG: YraN family protein [Christensenellales bacterium]|jgi:putative endonuclease